MHGPCVEDSRTAAQRRITFGASGQSSSLEQVSELILGRAAEISVLSVAKVHCSWGRNCYASETCIQLSNLIK